MASSRLRVAQSAGVACQVAYLTVDQDVQDARVTRRTATSPQQTFPMSEAELDQWREKWRGRKPQANWRASGEVVHKLGGAAGDRTQDRRIMRSTLGRNARLTCTNASRQCHERTHCTGIPPGAGPRPGPRRALLPRAIAVTLRKSTRQAPIRCCPAAWQQFRQQSPRIRRHPAAALVQPTVWRAPRHRLLPRK